MRSLQRPTKAVHSVCSPQRVRLHTRRVPTWLPSQWPSHASRSSWWRYIAVIATAGLVLSGQKCSEATGSAPPPLAVVRNDESGRVYYLRQILAEGAYGVVYACEDAFGQPLVMKVLKHADSLALYEQWKKEACAPPPAPRLSFVHFLLLARFSRHWLIRTSLRSTTLSTPMASITLCSNAQTEICGEHLI